MGGNGNENYAAEQALNKYEEATGKDGAGLASVSRAGDKARASSVLAEVDTRGIYKKDKTKELLIDLSARTNFRSRNERIYFLDWVDWCEEFGVGFDGPIIYMTTARSENGEGVQQLVDYYTRNDRHFYEGKGKKKELPSSPVES